MLIVDGYQLHEILDSTHVISMELNYFDTKSQHTVLLREVYIYVNDFFLTCNRGMVDTLDRHSRTFIFLFEFDICILHRAGYKLILVP